jgi:AcrR family transcriptional regulator
MEREGKTIDPRVKRTRKLLQQALLDLLQEQSFAGISIQNITERATVNRATFYAHFPDKYVLLDSLLQEQFQQRITSRFPATTLKWEAANVRILIWSSYEFLREVQRLCKPFDTQMELLVAKLVQQEITHVLLKWLKQGGGLKTPSRVRLKTVVSAMSWVILGTVIEWAFQQTLDEEELSPDEITNQVFLILTEGVARLVPGLFT